MSAKMSGKNWAMRAWRNGMTLAELREFFDRNEWECRICRTSWIDAGTRGNLVVDHDHSCCGAQDPNVALIDRPKRLRGKCARGLLCVPCNQGLGNFRDSPERLIKASQYLEGSLNHGK